MIPDPASRPRLLVGRAVKRRRPLVHDCVRIDATTLRRQGMLAAPCDTEWVATWTAPLRFPHRIAYRGVWYGTVLRSLVVATLMPGETAITRWGAVVPLTQTRPFLGGTRTWLVCPGVVNEYPCLRRVRIIFQPWGTDRWGCLLCLGLSYPSRRFHRFRFEEAFSRLERMQRLQRDLTSPRSRRRFRAMCRVDRELASLRKGLNQLARARRAERDRADG